MSVPRGFYEVAPQSQQSDYAAFVRGIMVPKPLFDKMSPAQRLDLLAFARDIEYGGPLQNMQVAQEWDTFLFFWANYNNFVWLSGGLFNVVPNSEIKWPIDDVFRWTWVHETQPPLTLVKKWDGNVNKWVWVKA